MKPILVISDCHIGTARTAGTTPTTAAALQQFLIDEFSRILNENKDKDVIINGDLFDKFTETNLTLSLTINHLSSWIEDTGNKLHLVPGNHDFSAKGDQLSSFSLMDSILKEMFPEQVVIYESKFTKAGDNIYIIPHCLNQFLFEEEIAKALQEPIKKGAKLLLHANYANHFSENSDHSLNLDEETLAALVTHGYQILGSHEHQARCLNLNGDTFKTLSAFDAEADIIVLGNQTPSSIADCLSHGQAQKDGKKYAHVIQPDGTIERQETWDNKKGFIRLNWDELDQAEDQLFIRVEGQVAQADVDDVFNKIAKFRRTSNSFIITNAVKVEGIDLSEMDLDVSLEDIKAFDVKGEFLKLFTKEEQEVLLGVMDDAN